MFYLYYENVTFKDLVYELYACCQAQGIPVKICSDIKKDNYLDLYLIFGMNDFSSQIVPKNYLVYQLEQTTGKEESGWFSQTYLTHLKNALGIWEYSLINYRHLNQMDLKNINYVPLQYMKSVDRVQHLEEKDIDIFFLGALNERRQVVLKQLEEAGLKVVVKTNVWGEERDSYLARSKIVINIHYYQHSILETTRLSYLLSNRCVVISEKSEDPILDRWHQKYVCLVDYEQLVSECVECVKHYGEKRELVIKALEDYRKESYAEKIPLKQLTETYGYLMGKQEDSNVGSSGDGSEYDGVDDVLPDVTDSSDLFEAEYEITPNKEIILKLPKYTDEDLPYLSVLTVTYNRRDIFPLAIRNWELLEYPRDKLEWVIVDDSSDGSSLSDILPKSKNVKYYKLTTTGRLSIGQKRNFAVKHSSYDTLICFDDDDLFYSLSARSRASLLLKHPNFDVVGVTDLDIYDVVNDFSAKITNRPFVSESSLGFRKSFWLERPFPEKANSLGEGYPFLKGRRNRVIKMPSCFNLIAMTHWTNYTSSSRSQSMFQNVEKKGNILSTLDLSSQLFIYALFDKIRAKREKEEKEKN